MNSLDIARKRAKARDAGLRVAFRDGNDKADWAILAIAALLVLAWRLGVFAS